MKYIRTKDGIWLFGGTHAKGKVIIGKKQETDFGYCFSRFDIIKQADTIEELCDEFVIEHNGKMCVFAKKYKETLWDIWVEKSKVIYGAIWTDKGLIYVAKLNDKGEWELL